MNLSIGLIGAGGITHVHIPAWLALGARVTVFSLEGSAAVAAHYGVGVADSLDELFDNCDVVDICTPTATHYRIAERALRAGKHVICEKPIALTEADADALAELAAFVGKQLHPAHVVRYFAEYALAQQAVAAGQVGEPAILRFSRIGEFPTWSSWFADAEQSGGIVLDQMIHDLDIARWIAGEVTEVYAVKSAGDGCETAQVVLTHASGALSYVTGVWGAPGTTFATSFSIAGSRGILTHDSRTDASLRFDLGAPPIGTHSMRPDTSLGESPYLTELREFAAAISGGATPRVSLGDATRAVGLAVAAIESIATGRTVSVSRQTVSA
ncbi:Gfo/Idh/MocA family oxidoreductase [Cryobacterium sp. PH29-G1]|uniref:Gfo/Idh/MocA family protein n=1 Tax=Cryobacterium sp. PH29-G1 TaxID=3046211 RepID=UPI0024B9A76C|nr:Gfo/Idh/MocA family oxidoreductase [Cryobacterium sp. PH29-G1]MDJ0347960.1 Gfo/Idh/MocA family oxidoreductase [Cryobacterium sp. PH29-G1]